METNKLRIGGTEMMLDEEEYDYIDAIIEHRKNNPEPIKRCNCKGIKTGTYERQIWLHSPAHMPKDNGYCIDLCISQEICQLWMNGITTTGCCCGHNYIIGYIGVIVSDIDKMTRLGYVSQKHPDGQQGYFTPKYDKLL